LKFRTRLTNQGIEISVQGDDEVEQPLTPAPDADQEHPRRNYVYAHIDSSGKIFYVGKGVGRRAWSLDRHPIWSRYVEKHLGGVFQVRILQDNLSPEEAEQLESDWIAQCSPDLVNWSNMGRDIDLQANARYHALRDANRNLIKQAKATERADLEKATTMYLSAIKAIDEYESIVDERGLVGQLLREEKEEIGRRGEIEALDRLTMCLIKLNRPEEAAAHAKSYFALYRLDLERAAARRIAKRIEEALACAPTSSALEPAAKQSD
jgi:hypothetical protein